MIQTYIKELVEYGIQKGLVAPADKVYTTNRLLELFEIQEYNEPGKHPVPSAFRHFGRYARLCLQPSSDGRRYNHNKRFI